MAVAIGGCASAPPAAQPAGELPHLHYVACGGVKISIPPSLRVVQAIDGELIAASREVALAVFEDGPPRHERRMRVIEQLSDADRPMYRIAFRDVDRCAFRVVALLPTTDDGAALLAAVADTTEPSMFVGSPRVRTEPALAVLLREVEDHL